MEIISTTIYSKHDTFGCWSVKWENRGVGFWKGTAKVAAIIIPNWEVLFKKLDEDGYISFYKCKSIIDQIVNPYSFNPYRYHISDSDKEVRFLNAFSDFCESEKIVKETKAFSFWDTVSIGDGNVGGFENAQKKIKKDLVLEGEDTVYKRLISFLRNRHLIN